VSSPSNKSDVMLLLKPLTTDQLRNKAETTIFIWIDPLVMFKVFIPSGVLQKGDVYIAMKPIAGIKLEYLS
jgi:hypothetical protein